MSFEELKIAYLNLPEEEQNAFRAFVYEHSGYSLSKEQIQELIRRIKQHEKGEGMSYSLEEVKEYITQRRNAH